jgi:hypothetical protein
MKYTFILLFFSYALWGQNQKSIIDFTKVNQEAREFINNAKKEAIGGGEYNVYVIKFTKDNKGYCVTYGYFEFTNTISEILKNKKFYRLDTELILVDIPELVSNSYEIIHTHFESLDKDAIQKKISVSPIMGTKMGYVYCYHGGQVLRNLYDSDDKVPDKVAIFRHKKNKGNVIKLDSNELRKAINED